MNYAMILAAGVGQRMRNGGLPKQFLRLMGKPIIVYTLEKFEQCEDIDEIIIVSHASYVDLMKNIIVSSDISKAKRGIVGGYDRQSSLEKGLNVLGQMNAKDDDIVVIHDGVRPIVSQRSIRENIRVAKQYGCAMTVRPVTESVVITDKDYVNLDDLKKRNDTYSLTSPQSFLIKTIKESYQNKKNEQNGKLPLLDAGMICAAAGNDIYLVMEQDANIKITTPEDYYFLKAILEMEENKSVFGL